METAKYITEKIIFALSGNISNDPDVLSAVHGIIQSVLKSEIRPLREELIDFLEFATTGEMKVRLLGSKRQTIVDEYLKHKVTE